MAMPFQIGSTYTFNTNAPGILGAIYKNAKVLGVVDYTIALTFSNVNVTAAAVLPVLPAGTPTDPKSYQYVAFQLENGSKVVLAMPWIDEASIVSITAVVITAVINGVDTTDVTRIRDVLLAMGYTNFKITSA